MADDPILDPTATYVHLAQAKLSATLAQLEDVKRQQDRLMNQIDRLRDRKADEEALKMLRQELFTGFERLEEKIKEQAKFQQTLATNTAVNQAVIGNKLGAVIAVLLGAGAFVVAVAQVAVTNKWFG